MYMISFLDSSIPYPTSDTNVKGQDWLSGSGIPLNQAKTGLETNINFNVQNLQS